MSPQGMLHGFTLHEQRLVLDDPHRRLCRFKGPKALQAAAEWVKAQALPAPPKGSTP